MKNRFVWLGLAAAVAVAPVAVEAASGLKGVMKTWKGHARAINAMASGQAAFDQAAFAQGLQAFIADSARVEAGINGRGSEAQDIKRRFVAFRADAQATLGDLGQPAAWKADAMKLKSDCQACHDLYKD